MPSSRTDWLDRLARRAVGGRDPARPPKPSNKYEDAPARGDRLSRTSALKLAVAGAGSLLLGLWRVPPARALSRAECIELCLDATQLLLNQRLQSCEDVFAPASLYKPANSWDRISTAFRLGAFSFVWDVTATGLMDICQNRARNEIRELREKCIDTCQDTCPPRFAPGRFLAASPSCQYRRPPKPKPPSVPPPPAPQAAGYCTYCATVTPPAYCDDCPSTDEGVICCALPKKDGKSPCCPG